MTSNISLFSTYSLALWPHHWTGSSLSSLFVGHGFPNKVCHFILLNRCFNSLVNNKTWLHVLLIVIAFRHKEVFKGSMELIISEGNSTSLIKFNYLFTSNKIHGNPPEVLRTT
jgi:hypothetical protein